MGTGFTATALRDLQQRLTPLHRDTPPVGEVPREHARGARWVAPLLVGEVVYRTLTTDLRLRHAAWRGLRPDREPHEAVLPGALAAPPAAAVGAQVEVPQVEGEMRTPDGRWQVQAVHRGAYRWYRLVHGGNIIDQLDLHQVEDILADAGVRLHDLTEAVPAPEPSRLGRALAERQPGQSVIELVFDGGG